MLLLFFCWCCILHEGSTARVNVHVYLYSYQLCDLDLQLKQHKGTLTFSSANPPRGVEDMWSKDTIGLVFSIITFLRPWFLVREGQNVFFSFGMRCSQVDKFKDLSVTVMRTSTSLLWWRETSFQNLSVYQSIFVPHWHKQLEIVAERMILHIHAVQINFLSGWTLP